MKTAPATFRRMMCDSVISVLQSLESFADAYIDDVEVDAADTLENTQNIFLQHLTHLRAVFD